MMKSNPSYPLLTRILWPILVIVFSISCDRSRTIVDFDAETKTDVAYGDDPRQKLDLYLPDNRNQLSTSLIVLIHGGGWSDGDKNDLNSLVPQLQSRLPEYAIANINYRLAKNGQNLFPTQENDVKKAVDYLINHANDLGYSKRIVLIGLSAGAHLALLQAYKYPTNVEAVVTFFGPTELIALYNNPPGPYIPQMLQAVTGTTPALNANLYMQSSPTSFINSRSAPTLILQGGKDPLVPVSQAELLKTKLEASHVTTTYVFYPNEAHGWTGTSLEDSFNQIRIFLAANVN